MIKTTKPCVEFDYSKLRGRIIEKFGTIRSFAEAIGRQNSWVSNVLHNKKVLDSRDIAIWASALELEDNEIGGIFFVIKVVE